MNEEKIKALKERMFLTDEEIQLLESRCMLPCTDYDRQVAQAQLTKAIPIIRQAVVEERERTGIRQGSIIKFKPCDCHEIQAKVLNISAPSLGGERMVLVEAFSEKYERLEHEVTIVE